MAFLRLLAWLTVRRAKAHGRIMLASALGVVLIIALATGAMLHSQGLAEAGLRHALVTNASNQYHNLQIFLTDRPLGEKDYLRLDGVVGEGIAEHIPWLFTGMHRFGISREIPYVFNKGDVPPTENIPIATPFFMGDFREHSQLVSGRWPGKPSFQEDGTLVLEGTVGSQMAEFLRLTEGTTVYLVPLADSPYEKIALTIVGVMEPVNSDEAYWFQDTSHFRASFDAETEDGESVASVYVGEEGFFKGLGASYPLLLGEYRWYVFLDFLSLTAETGPQARTDLLFLESDLNKKLARAYVFSSLTNLVEEYQRDLALARVPLFMFVSLVVGVVLYYLTVTTMLQARERGAEAAVLRSRGASVLQAGGLLGLGEGVVTVAPGMILGPLIGWATNTAWHMGAEGLEYPSPGLSLPVLAAAILAGLLCIGLFFATGIGVASRSIVGYLRERGRTPERIAFSRYAVDVLVLGLLGLLWWQIKSQGGLLSRPLQGSGFSVDLALLLGPAIALMAAGLALLRVMPFLLRGAARLGGGLGMPWLVHSLRRMAREPAAYAALAVLLMLATALGVFGAAFGATLTSGRADLVRYRVGGEIVTPPRFSTLNLEGVEAFVPVMRSTLSTPGDPAGRGAYSVMAVLPKDFPKAAWFREDFAGKSLEDLLRPLREPLPVEPGLLLPPDTEALGMWVKTQQALPGYELRVRVRDVVGRMVTLTMGNLDSTGWTFMEAPMPQAGVFEPPLYLSGILIRGGNFTGYGSGWLDIDDITALVQGERMVVDELESPGRWTPLPNMTTAADGFSTIVADAHSGIGALRFSWTNPITNQLRGLIIPSVPFPIPAIASDNFHVGQSIKGTLEGLPVEVRVAETVSYFPTLYASQTPFLVVNLEHLLLYLLGIGYNRPDYLAEFWIGLEETTDREEAVATLKTLVRQSDVVFDQEALVLNTVTDPLQGGAWESIALQGAIALGIASLLGFGLYAGITVRRSRLELGVLRAMGFSRRSISFLFATEGALVAAIGVGIGALLGAWLSRWTLGYMSISAGGRLLTPPMLLSTEGWLLLLALAEVAVAVGASVGIALSLARRVRLHEVLRVEE
ncbi:MAG: ABC transporter permease [Chloroflexi bacterium]|nr:ABC transporter permease [Chloroflexota bacterium]